MKRYIFYIMFLLILASCKSAKPINHSPVKTPTLVNKSGVKPKPSGNSGVGLKKAETVVQYVEQYKSIAMSNMKNYGIPASIILAQGILESGAGNSNLALTSNNHFGIKCHNDWEGEYVHHDDDSEKECFRKYNDPSGSFKDHATFLTTKKRYASLFSLPKGDYVGWAKGLRAAGYATDPQYPEKLIAYIEKYDLHQFDSEVMGKKALIKTEPKRVEQQANDNTDALYEVQKGDTLYSISKKFNILVEELQRKNRLDDNAISIGQKLIIK